MLCAVNGTAGRASDTYAGRVYKNEGLTQLVDMVESECVSILDLGCGAGSNLALLADRGHEVVGLTISSAEAEACAGRGLRVVVADLVDELPFADSSFDGVVMSHVLEHIAEPAMLLRRARALLRPNGRVFAAIPNVLYYKQRFEFLRGHFEYADSGLLDRTHLRFFDFDSALALISEAGFEVVDTAVDGGVPSLGLRRRLPGFWGRLDTAGLGRFPGLFGYQFVIEARPR